MLNIINLKLSDFFLCHEIINKNNGDLSYLEKLGWTINQFKIQLSKDSNFGMGIFREDKLIGFVVGDVIKFEKEIEYELLLLYVKLSDRKLGLASNLLKQIVTILKKKKLKKIYLEVALNNLPAINLYIANNYKKIGVRKKYYSIKNKKIDALLFEKKINE